MSSVLRITAFGGLSIYLDDKPVTGFASRKAEALLVYLVLSQRPQRREVLADMFWDDRTQSQSMANLRVLLTSLRQNLGEYIEISRDIVALNQHSTIWIDVREFEQSIEDSQHARLNLSPQIRKSIHHAVTDLYQGEFLDGFFVTDCRRFEKWLVTERERLHSLEVDGLYKLAADDLDRKDFSTGIVNARRLLQVDPLMEAGYRLLIRLLVLNGQREEALRQFETCRSIMITELGLEPDADTIALHELIRKGGLISHEDSDDIPAVRLPDFLAPGIGHISSPVLVSRDTELARLDGFLEKVMAGHGQMTFISGDAGSGKTALLKGFSHHAYENIPDLLIATAKCEAYSGFDIPYLPIRDLLKILTGDIESQLAGNSINLDQARRIWSVLPLTLSVVFERGRNLLNSFIPAQDLAGRLRLAEIRDKRVTAWLGELNDLTKDMPGILDHSQIFEQVMSVFESIASHIPLILILDDLQWADIGTINFLFYMARRLEGKRILILASYRSEEIRSRSNEVSENLHLIISEIKRMFGDVWIDLDASRVHRGQQFIWELVDSEPNRLSPDFRQILFQHTGGHPLFTVELLRVMKESGDLRKDEQGIWFEAADLQWDVIPARVEGVINVRLAQLSQESQRILKLASLMGPEFSLHVLADITGESEANLAQLLGEELSQRQRIIQELGGRETGSQRDFFFCFTHALFQKHLQDQVSEAERHLYHGQIGNSLEDLYGRQSEEIASWLAYHFTEAGILNKAVKYLLVAGDQARLLYAHGEAIKYYRRALELLQRQGDSLLVATTQMKLGLAYQIASEPYLAQQAYQEGFWHWQKNDAPHLDEDMATSLILRGHIGMFPETLDPARRDDNLTSLFTYHLFTGLLRDTPEMGIVPDVAVSWELQDSGRRYIFHLREDACWSDGIPLTAGDFVFAWKRVLGPPINSPNSYLLADIQGADDYHLGKMTDPDHFGAKAVDDHTLVVDLDRPATYFPLILTNTIALPVPRHRVERFGESWADPERIVSNGPFTIANWEPDTKIELARNPNYHGRFKGNVGRVELLVFQGNREEAVRHYASGGIDFLFLGFLPLSLQNSVVQRFAGDFRSVPGLRTVFLVLDSSQFPFNDRRVRQAFALAIDKKSLLKEVGGTNSPAMGGFVPPGMSGHSPGIGLTYDPQKARQLMAEAGYPDGRGFPGECVLRADIDDTYFKSTFKNLSAQWRNVLNIQADWEIRSPEESPNEQKILKDDSPQIFLPTGWIADYPDPDTFLRVAVKIFTPTYQDPLFWQLMSQAQAELNQVERLRLYQRADQALMQDASIIPLFYPRMNLLVKPWTYYPISANKLGYFKDVTIKPH